MNDASNLQFLKNEITARISGASGRERFYRRRALFVGIAGAGLSALTTVLIGADSIIGKSWLKLIPLITSALVTFLAAYEGFMRNRHLWIQTNATRMRFYELQSDIAYREAGNDPITEQEVDGFYARYKEILEVANRSWETVRMRAEQE